MSYSNKFPWIISDKERSITIESVKEGLKIYDNPVGILTNNPPFESQMFNLNNYMSLEPHSLFAALQNLIYEKTG